MEKLSDQLVHARARCGGRFFSRSQRPCRDRELSEDVDLIDTAAEKFLSRSSCSGARSLPGSRLMFRPIQTPWPDLSMLVRTSWRVAGNFHKTTVDVEKDMSADVGVAPS